MIQINPYRRNCEVIKKFFGNPVILIISILFFISAIASVAVDFISGNFHGFPVVKLLSAIGFLFFYIKGRKNSEVTSFGQPVNFLTVAGIISIVINTLALVAMALLLILNYSFNLPETVLSRYVLSDLIYTLTFYTPVYLINLIASVALLVLLSSIKKSSRSIYLYKKGSLFFAVASFVFAFVMIGYIAYTGISFALISTVIEVIVLIMLGVFSIMYNRYITNVSSSISVPEPVAETIDTSHIPEPVAEPELNTPVRFEDSFAVAPKPKKKSKASKTESYDSSLVNMWDTSERTPEQNIPDKKDFSPQTISFEPQPVFVQNNVTPIAPLKTEEPVVNKTAPESQEEAVIEEKPFSFCTFCGKKCPPENHYCGACGNKLTK